MLRVRTYAASDPSTAVHPAMHAPVHHEFAPPATLRHAIKCFWHHTRDTGPLASTFEVLPDGWVEIIFHFGGGVGEASGSAPLPSPFMMRLLTQPVCFGAQGRVDVIGIRCYPWAVFDLLGLSPGTDGQNLRMHPLARLQSTLARCVQAGRIDEALTHIERHLLAAQAHSKVDRMLARAGAALREAHGSMPVGEVAVAAHATVRTLERRFKLVSGHTVKEVSGLIRFEQVRNALFQGPPPGIAGLAHALGYTDQAHLGREFKRYSGTTPAAFARQRRLDADFGGFIQA
jgi:AraC-like DNA-binding protein